LHIDLSGNLVSIPFLYLVPDLEEAMLLSLQIIVIKLLFGIYREFICGF